MAYSAASLTGPARLLYALNPAVGVARARPLVLVGATLPGLALWSSRSSWPSLLAVVGCSYFQRSSRSFADVI